MDVTGEERLMSALMLVAAIVTLTLAFPDTDIGRRLNRWLVEAPARALNRVPRGKALAWVLLAALGFILALLFEADGVRLFGFLLPDTLAWFALFDVGVFVDALLITGAILATNGLRTVRAQAAALPRALLTRVRRRAAGARRAPSKRPVPRADDDDRPAGTPQAGYLAFSMA